MMQRWREKLKYIEAGMIISALILFVATLIFGDNLTLEEIEKMKRQEEEELKDIV